MLDLNTALTHKQLWERPWELLACVCACCSSFISPNGHPPAANGTHAGVGGAEAMRAPSTSYAFATTHMSAATGQRFAPSPPAGGGPSLSRDSSPGPFDDERPPPGEWCPETGRCLQAHSANGRVEWGWVCLWQAVGMTRVRCSSSVAADTLGVLAPWQWISCASVCVSRVQRPSRCQLRGTTHAADSVAHAWCRAAETAAVGG
jgi:hypothetical protein